MRWWPRGSHKRDSARTQVARDCHRVMRDVTTAIRRLTPDQAPRSLCLPPSQGPTRLDVRFDPIRLGQSLIELSPDKFVRQSLDDGDGAAHGPRAGVVDVG